MQYHKCFSQNSLKPPMKYIDGISMDTGYCHIQCTIANVTNITLYLRQQSSQLSRDWLITGLVSHFQEEGEVQDIKDRERKENKRGKERRREGMGIGPQKGGLGPTPEKRGSARRC